MISGLTNHLTSLELQRKAADDAAQASHLRYIKSIYAQQETTEAHLLQSHRLRSTYSLDQMNQLSTTLPNPLHASVDSYCYSAEANTKQNTSLPTLRDHPLLHNEVAANQSKRTSSPTRITLPVSVEVIVEEQESVLESDIAAPQLPQVSSVSVY